MKRTLHETNDDQNGLPLKRQKTEHNHHHRQYLNTSIDGDDSTSTMMIDDGELERRETLREVWEQVSSSLNRLEQFVLQDKDKQKRPWNTQEYADMYT
jgi:hypothetical protein